MKKRILAFLMTGVLLISNGVSGVFAEPVMSQEIAVGLSGTEETESFGRQVEFGGGYRKPEVHEVEEALTEIYKEEADTHTKASAVYKSQWDSYSSNYYYNQLSDTEQEFWDKLDNMCYSYLTGMDNLQMDYDGSFNQIYPTKTVVFSGMTAARAETVTFMFVLCNPQYYFLETGYYISSKGNAGTITFTVFPAFANGSARAAATAQMKSVIDSWVAQINAQPDVLSKEKMAHDLICDKVDYDNNYRNPNAANIYNQVVYSVFCTDSTVCAGYSQAMQLLMNAVGIDCSVVTSLEHEWNIIRLNNTWYYIDLTWADQQNVEPFNMIMYDYFNRSQAVYMDDYLENVVMHTTESFWNGYLPELIYDSGSTITRPGALHIPEASQVTPQIIPNNDIVTIVAPAGGAVYYTTDGTNPSIAFSKSDKYTGPFEVKGKTVVKAVAVANGQYDSGVSEITVIPKYNVVFNANGGYIGKKGVKTTSRVVEYGNAVGQMAAAKRKGYAFLGWFNKKSGGKEISNSFTITEDTTLYAQWAKVKPAGASITSLKNRASKSIEVKIKNNKKASGYQIRYSTNKNMSSAKKKEVTDNVCTIKKLKKKKTYYVQVRVYQKDSVSGKKKYGSWSKVGSVKVKK